ncbi:MAG: bifunctional DNA-binding transcriptional regulator/O6-methylguanine-DNA methyltransferase Ada [Rhizobiaceae bacterium]|nr:bifunctional DNA-binding transcriptional regulator/O6-methylguanine-DNA methyltransferase Ada [Rhizobiaceae bacterium]PCI02814.1 MAG: bifunctional DNA-binding transcriptional regulator/O6-methylguanine-DNA methyltransferase Ada [Hyphomicrobiales bacterium]
MTTTAGKFINEKDRWDAMVNHSAEADGHFYYSVKTTGVYCRPSCAARLALRENVAFHLTCDDAEGAGFRPCRRCKPDQPPLVERQATVIAKACRLIEQSEEAPTLETLAGAVSMSAYHFHRIFKRVTGVTPKAYANAHRADKIRRELSQSSSVTDAIYGAGFNSNGPFYATSSKTLGMTPSKYRSGGSGEIINFAVGECGLGSVLVAASKTGICAILLGDSPDMLAQDLQDRFPNAMLEGGDNSFEEWVAKVVGFVEAPQLGLDLPLDIRGTAFQQRVWQALRAIPIGSTVSYAEVARAIGSPKAARAIAKACAANAIAIAIPCHRVVRNDGAISGYRWGVERKRQLLEQEASL